jgi:hypothetical protein
MLLREREPRGRIHVWKVRSLKIYDSMSNSIRFKLFDWRFWESWKDNHRVRSHNETLFEVPDITEICTMQLLVSCRTKPLCTRWRLVLDWPISVKLRLQKFIWNSLTKKEKVRPILQRGWDHEIVTVPTVFGNAKKGWMRKTRAVKREVVHIEEGSRWCKGKWTKGPSGRKVKWYCCNLSLQAEPTSSLKTQQLY